MSERSVIEAIHRRRSMRDGFSDRPVSREVLEKIAACGLAAPSSKSARPWRFHLVNSKALLSRLADLVLTADDADTYVPWDPQTGRPRPEYVSTVAESAEALRAAGAAVFIENRGVFTAHRRALVEADVDARASSIMGYTLEVLGIGAAIQNLWLAAEASGLRGVFMGDVLIAEAEFRDLMGIDNDLMGVFIMGHPASPEAVPSWPKPPPGEDEVRWCSFSDEGRGDAVGGRR